MSNKRPTSGTSDAGNPDVRKVLSDMLSSATKYTIEVVKDKYDIIVNAVTDIINVYHSYIVDFNIGELPPSAHLNKEISALPIVKLRDDLEVYENSLLNRGLWSIGLSDGQHFVLLARASLERVPTFVRKYKIPNEVIDELLSGKRLEYPCPVCGRPAKLEIRPGNPIALALGLVLRRIREDVIDAKYLPSIAAKTPIYPWAKHVMYLGPASIVKLASLIEAHLARNVMPKITGLWKYAGLHAVNVCFNVTAHETKEPIIVEAIANTGNRCPACGQVLEGFAASKFSFAELKRRVIEANRKTGKGSKVTIYTKDGRWVPDVDIDQYFIGAMGNPTFRKHMWVIAQQYRPMPNKRPSVYTLLAVQFMLDLIYSAKYKEPKKFNEMVNEIVGEEIYNKLIEKATEEVEEKYKDAWSIIQERKWQEIVNAVKGASEKGGTGIASIYNRWVWRKIAKVLVAHAAEVTAIMRGMWQGPPKFLKEGHVYIPPLVDDDVDKAAKDLEPLIEWYDKHMGGVKLVQVWSEYRRAAREDYEKLYKQLISEINDIAKQAKK
ncbi:MAG: hypothetical protein L7H04_06045 [Vulcanisaeta sp.]|nr:hypothetical protein [Vulcanisaeta sp.]